jgi:hypothetical protein
MNKRIIMQVNLPFNIGDIIYVNETRYSSQPCEDCNGTTVLEITSDVDGSTKAIRCPFCRARDKLEVQTLSAEIKHIDISIGDMDKHELKLTISPMSGILTKEIRINLANCLKDDSLILCWPEIKWKKEVCYKTEKEALEAQKV